ncbi:LOW QUALITY PROTEIN: hypothetical protein HID58_014500 [Brassica napus]|uniref:STAS domain-containing protein n=2 Tax=Brassica napus TaxID=3708 RepID=A0ABQ8DHU9_BRANA|nr:LOW QUALITY PROTEIN: hypothetical protein HID58_014500 [Brassica napus]
MGGAGMVVSRQQLKDIFGLKRLTEATDVISIWRWESGVLGCSTKKPKFFWVAAMAPLTSVILGSLLVYLTHAERHGVQVIGNLKKGLNPLSISDLRSRLYFALHADSSQNWPHYWDHSSRCKSFAMFKNYNIVGNNEMIAFGMMNIVGSLTSCYLITGPFSRSAVNFNAGCKTIVSNIVMAIAVMFTLLFLTPLFYYTPLVVLSSIIMVAMRVGGKQIRFLVCMSAYLGAVFSGYINSKVVAIRVKAEDCGGNMPNSPIYRNTEQYPYSRTVPGLLILEIDAPIYFANAGYLRERITSWIDEEEERVKTSGENSLQYVILDMSAGGNIDTSGINMMEEIKKIMDRRKLKLVLVNPKGEVVKKLTRSKFIGDNLDKEWMFMTVGEAVEACSYVLHTLRTVPASKDSNNV